MSQPTVFISYSHKDKGWIKDWFLPRFENNGFKAHIDFRDFDIGQPSLVNMERAVETCDKTILVCSPDYIISEFCLFEAILLQTEDPIGVRKKILPLMLHDCQLPKRLKMFTYADFRDESEWESQLTRLKAQIKKDLEGKEEAKPIYLPPDKVDIVRLPQTGYELFGRQKELTLLNDAWESETINVIAFVAYGGTGKSTLVNKWLEKMRWDNYRGAKRVFAWSFYSQGTGERVTSADLFIKEALVWFGDANPEAGSPWDKGKRLANLIRQDKTLLILDGLEPLQSYLDVEKGKIKDPAVSVLVTELAKNNNGLCTITTREEIPDIRRFPSSARQVNLEQISDEAGRALLRVRGIRGTDAELEGITRAFGNHALAINLLAEYLHLIPGHPAEKAQDIPDLDIPEEQGKHPRRVIEAFAAHFGEGTELELLHILGLFDRPADKTAINAVIQNEPIPGLTECLLQLSKDEWFDVLEKLRKTKLLAPKSEHRPDTLDCHPLIREHFSQKLRAKSQQAWKEANSRLYEYFKNQPGKELPDTLEEMEPLFMAVVHGCRTGKYQEVLEEIYFSKIMRENEAYIYHKIGAFGSNLSALSNFYESPWDKINPNLTDICKAVTLSWTGFTLRALGRLREAAQPMQLDVKMAIEQKDWQGGAVAAGNLSELYLTLGDVAQAVSLSRQRVEFADKSGDDFQRFKLKSRLANSLFQIGEILKAETEFQEAEKIHPFREMIVALEGYWYCDLLLSQSKYNEVQIRANFSLEVFSLKEARLLDTALDRLSLGRTYFLQALTSPSVPLQRGKIMEQATDYLNQAVDGLRKAGREDHLPRSLFARAELYRLQGDYPSAWDDLEEAHDIAERGEMRLWLTDYHLGAARLISRQLAVSSQQSSIGSYQVVENGRQVTLNRDQMVNRMKMHLEKATELVKKTGYHRRDSELLLLQAQLHFASGDRENARIWLNKAKERFDEMGIRMWDFEVRLVEQAIG